MHQILPQDETPTPTKFLKNADALFKQIKDKNPDGESGTGKVNPFDAQFKAETPEPGVTGNNLEGPEGEPAEIHQTDCPSQDHEEIISDGNVHKEVVIEDDVIEEGQDADKQFKVSNQKFCTQLYNRLCPVGRKNLSYRTIFSESL